MKKLECVVLLNGNFVVIPVLENKKKELSEMLHDCNKKSNGDPTIFLKYEDNITILAKEIVGWYFRDVIEPSTKKVI